MEQIHKYIHHLFFPVDLGASVDLRIDRIKSVSPSLQNSFHTIHLFLHYSIRTSIRLYHIAMVLPATFPTAPYSEPLLPQLDIKNPYYTETHHALRAYVRNYVDTHIAPYAQDWETAGQVPESVRRKHCELGFGIVHPLTTPEDAAGLALPGNVPREKWDTWCSLIVGDELTRTGFVGVVWGLGAGNGIGCPPVAKFGTVQQRRRWLPAVARGDIRFCLGITEPDGEIFTPLCGCGCADCVAGSDVANIKTTAKHDGDHYVVNGAKKWITNGIWADYCTAAVRTGGPGKGGISLLVIPLKAPGVTCKRMYNSGVNASGRLLYYNT